MSAACLALLATLLAWRSWCQCTAILRQRTRSVTVRRGGVIALYLLRTVYLALLGAAIYGLWATPTRWPGELGIVVFFAGVSLRVYALAAIGDCYSDVRALYKGHRLVEVGPYRRLRHPLALGMLLEFLGLALLSERPWTLVMAAAGAATLLTNNVKEERLLVAHFGARYQEMRRRTWDLVDWLPVPGLLRRTSTSAGPRTVQDACSRLQLDQRPALPADGRSGT